MNFKTWLSQWRIVDWLLLMHCGVCHWVIVIRKNASYNVPVQKVPVYKCKNTVAITLDFGIVLGGFETILEEP